VLNKNLSVRALENLIKSYSTGTQTNNTSKKSKDLPAEVKKIQDGLSANLGTSVKIKRSEMGSGEISIKFKSDSEFNEIIRVLNRLED
jgi:hypothetical protein